jgi:hypothetical protein
MRLALLGSLSVAAAACGIAPLLPDGGRSHFGCSDTEVSVPVKVVSASGQPAAGARIRAAWLSAGALTQTLVTDQRGVATVRSPVGPGVVRVQAVVDGRSSSPADITFLGGDCVSSATPSQLTLALEAP